MRARERKAHKPPALGPFLRGVEAAVESVDADTLRALTLAHARRLDQTERRPFLELLSDHVSVQGTGRAAEAGDNCLLDDIDAFVARLADCEYFEGWGWDDAIYDDRAWGDESWADEMDALFGRANDAFAGGDYGLALAAYEKLFAAFDLEEEVGTFCGSDIPRYMVSTDLTEAKARCLRVLYETTPAGERPARLVERLDDLMYVGGRVGLRAIADADAQPLPGFEEFLPEWISALGRAKASEDRDYGCDSDLGALLREAVFLADGVDGLAALARREGGTHPEAYFDWVAELVREKKTDAAIDAAREGTDRIQDAWSRAALADRLAVLAAEKGDGGLALEARRRAWNSEPTLRRLLWVCATAGPDVAARDRILSEEFKHAQQNGGRVPCRLVCVLEWLVGEYDAVARRAAKVEPLGWSTPDGAGQAAFAFLLLAGTGIEEPPAGSCIAGIFQLLDRRGARYEPYAWDDLEEDDTDGMPDELLAPEYSSSDSPPVACTELLRAALERRPVPHESREPLLTLARSIAVKRMRTIVSKQYRKAYERAASVIVACAEAFHLTGRTDEGIKLLKQAHNEFRRHSAFRRELRELGRTSVLLGDAYDEQTIEAK